MKTIKYIAIIFIGASMFSCHKLGVAPLNIIGDADIFGTENGVTAYLSGIYNTLPMEDFIYEPNSGFMINDGGRWQCFYHPGALDGELAGPYGGTGDAIGGFGFWDYTDIRTINYMLQTLPKYASNFTQQEYEQYMGEAYFCRAYFYFALVKRYGGVPIITTPQNPTDDSATLYVHRAKEEDVYNFIASDLDSAYNLLPETSDRGRANKYVAASYKSLAMLFAGSIAKYGSQNYVVGPARDQGIVGIPAGDANKFFQEAYDAAKLVEGHYSLYEKEMDDPVKNYRDLFLDQSSPEDIFVRDYSLTSPTTSSSAPHSWDCTMTCIYFTSNGLSRAYPTLDLVERWGSFASKITNPDGTPKRFADRNDLKAGLSPRLRASIFFPGDTLRNKIFDIRRGIYQTFTGSAAQEATGNLNSPNDGGNNLLLAPDASVSTTVNGTTMTVVGLAGAGTSGDAYTRTGFYVAKYIDYNKTQAECNLYESTQSYIDMRYAEVLLNRAEAAMELGTADMKADAVNCINLLRERGGEPDVTNLTIDTVRNEREKELCFEHQYWWDIRRWRIADQILDNTKFYALLPYYVASENKYIFLKQIEPFQRTYTFTKQYYYEPIPSGELGKNPNLYPNNPGF